MLALKYKNHIITILSISVVVGLIYVFTTLCVYLVISMILTLIASPIVTLVKKLKFKNQKLSSGLTAFIVMLLLFFIVYIFAIICIPSLFNELSIILELSYKDLIHELFTSNASISKLLLQYGNEKELIALIEKNFSKLSNYNNLTYIINNTYSIMGSLVGGIFSVCFITFFFIKDQKLISQSILLFTPTNYTIQMNKLIITSKAMMSRYFIGLLIDVFFVGFVVGSSLWVAGIKHALLIGTIAGLLNIIPYIGPCISIITGVMLSICNLIVANQFEQVPHTVIITTTIIASVYLIDAIIVQPYIFSNTVKAHPLELFVVTIMAGKIGGIFGMIIAIPVYTLLRITSKVFLTNYKFFKEVSKNV